MITARSPSKSTILRICIVFCFINIVLVTVLAGAGVLKTAERGDIHYTSVEETPHGDIIAEDTNFVVERPTDVDAFYDAVVRVRNGGPLLNPWGSAETIQRFHYHPIVISVFYPLYFLGYVPFKFAWLILSLLFTGIGTYLILRAEENRWNLGVSKRQTILLSTAALGFGPMVTNFKTGHPTPLIYLFVALSWWHYRENKFARGGLSLIVPMIIKPYFVAPLVVYFKRESIAGITAFILGIIIINILTTFVLGFDTLVTYYEVLVDFALNEGEPFRNTGFDKWFANTLLMFFWFGTFAPIVRFLFTIPLAVMTVEYLLEWTETPTDMFAYANIMVMFLLSTTSVTDLAIILAAFVVLGYRLYALNGTKTVFALLGLSFLLMHVHEYFMEFFVGVGPTVLTTLADNEQLIISVVPYFQPAMWGLFIFFGLLVLSVTNRVPWSEHCIDAE